MQPGDTITPGDASDNKEQEVELKIPRDQQTDEPKTETSAPIPEQSPAPAPEETPPAPVESTVPAQALQDANSPWQYGSETTPDDSFAAAPELSPVSWSASEYIEHDKQSSWFMTVIIIAVVASIIAYLLLHDLVTSIVIILVAALFAAAGARRPRTLNYQLDTTGIHIAQKLYPYGDFKSFSVLEEGAINSVQLLPLKRFMPPISLYFPPDQEEQVIMTLGAFLPHEFRELDGIDRLMRRLRF